ncbi:MAG: 3-dehydroquinate synthase [Pseudomonadota bacterium]
MPNTHQTLTVSLPERSARSYPIHIGNGLMADIGTLLKPHLKRPRVSVVTEDRVNEAQGTALSANLAKAGIEAEAIILSPGESTKSFRTLAEVVRTLLEQGVERGDVVIAYGGGVIGDLTGFACSMIRRGCRFIQVPTTLLAQVDSAVGGKTAINVPEGKNLVGAFYQPEAVISDIDLLTSLPDRERRAGYAEIVKYGLLGDASFFTRLEDKGLSVLANEPGATIDAVKTSCAMKAAIVAEDEREEGRRAVLNLGHTFGHALEAAFGFSDALLHGEGVALGMVMAFDYAVHEGLCPADDAARVKTHLRAMGCPVTLGDVPAFEAVRAGLNPDHLLGLMLQDKKVEQAQITLILPHKIGDAHIHRGADTETLRAFWVRQLAPSAIAP